MYLSFQFVKNQITEHVNVALGALYTGMEVWDGGVGIGVSIKFHVIGEISTYHQQSQARGKNGGMFGRGCTKSA